jgi:hypothetical protein
MDAPTPDPIDRARELMERTAPVLRDVNAALEKHGITPDPKGSFASRAASLMRRADEAVSHATAIEGTVVERTTTSATSGETTTTTVVLPPAPEARLLPMRTIVTYAATLAVGAWLGVRLARR